MLPVEISNTCPASLSSSIHVRAYAHTTRTLLRTPHGQGYEQSGPPHTAQHSDPWQARPQTQPLSSYTPCHRPQGVAAAAAAATLVRKRAAHANPTQQAAQSSGSRPGTCQLVYRRPDYPPVPAGATATGAAAHTGTQDDGRQPLSSICNAPARQDAFHCNALCRKHTVCCATVTSQEGAMAHTHMHTQTCCEDRSWCLVGMPRKVHLVQAAARPRRTPHLTTAGGRVGTPVG